MESILSRLMHRVRDTLWQGVVGLALSLTATIATAAPPNDVTEAEVRQYLTQVERAIGSRDIKALLSLYSPQLTIIVRGNIQGRTVKFQVPRDDYFLAMRNLWSLPSLQYQYSYTAENIMCLGQKAIVSGRGWETMQLDGESGTFQADSTQTIERVDGRLLLTKTVVTVRL